VAKRVVIRGGIVSTDSDVFRADVVIDGEQVAALTSDASGMDADEIIDATDKLVVPGGIDAHTHFKDPDPNEIEGFYYGSMGAVAGGISSVVEMPQATPTSTEAQQILEKIKVGEEKSLVDFALWGAAINQDLSDIEDMIDAGIVAVKSFMAGSSPGFPKITDASMYEVFLLLSDTDIPNGLHAENDDLLQEGIRRMQEEAEPTRWRTPSRDRRSSRPRRSTGRSSSPSRPAASRTSATPARLAACRSSPRRERAAWRRSTRRRARSIWRSIRTIWCAWARSGAALRRFARARRSSISGSRCSTRRWT
jgi:hypothetical protein